MLFSQKKKKLIKPKIKNVYFYLNADGVKEESRALVSQIVIIIYYVAVPVSVKNSINRRDKKTKYFGGQITD